MNTVVLHYPKVIDQMRKLQLKLVIKWNSILVSLTKVKKKTKSSKANLLEEIRGCVIGYNNLFLIRNVNLRSSFLNKVGIYLYLFLCLSLTLLISALLKVRKDFSPLSRIFFGKNHLMSVALGKTKADEIQVDLHKISNIIKGM